MIKKLIERVLIKILKLLKADLLEHAHVQAGVGHNTYISGEENIIEEMIVKLLKREPAMIFDVGANIGDYTTSLRKKFHQTTIHCFEPVANSFARLVNHTNGMNIHCHNFGLSEQTEAFDLYIASEDTDRSMATAYPQGIEQIFTFIGTPDTKVSCNFTTIDEFCKTNGITQIDFLKIDVEGHELKVLKGGKAMIASNAIQLIQFEFNEFNIVSRSFMLDFYNILPQFLFFRIMPNNTIKPLGDYHPTLEIFMYQNILAVNKSLTTNF